MYWVSLEPTDTDKELLKSLRDARYSQVDARTYDTESNPHLTIVPGFSVPTDTVPNEEDIPTNLPIQITFSSYHVWPSLENPMVVALDPTDTAELQSLREHTLEYIETLNGNIEYDPTPFHLTLFKGGDAGDEDAFTVGQASQDAIKNFVEVDDSLPITVEFDTLSVSEWIV